MINAPKIHLLLAQGQAPQQPPGLWEGLQGESYNVWAEVAILPLTVRPWGGVSFLRKGPLKVRLFSLVIQVTPPGASLFQKSLEVVTQNN